jgi:putative addiction module component (TIGR02574 family)
MHQLGIDAWSADDRLRLIEEIWDSLPSAYPAEISESHRAEIDLRLAAADADPSAASPWQDAMARLRSRS